MKHARKDIYYFMILQCFSSVNYRSKSLNIGKLFVRFRQTMCSCQRCPRTHEFKLIFQNYTLKCVQSCGGGNASKRVNLVGLFAIILRKFTLSERFKTTIPFRLSGFTIGMQADKDHESTLFLNRSRSSFI